MKKVLLLIISLFAIPVAALAYETVIINFPPGGTWNAVYHETLGTETILQYVPNGQTGTNWTKTLVFHSYKTFGNGGSAAALIDRSTMEMETQNPSQLYKYLKYTAMDSIATRCVQKNAITPTQCDIYRTSKSFEGLISMQYINKNTQEFKNTYNMWYNIVKSIRIYRSYYRTDRIMDKATTFEL